MSTTAREDQSLEQTHYLFSEFTPPLFIDLTNEESFSYKTRTETGAIKPDLPETRAILYPKNKFFQLDLGGKEVKLDKSQFLHDRRIIYLKINNSIIRFKLSFPEEYILLFRGEQVQVDEIEVVDLFYRETNK